FEARALFTSSKRSSITAYVGIGVGGFRSSKVIERRTSNRGRSSLTCMWQNDDAG
ncbi:unnamed protein product, partial [Ectocarpus sp. 12 AP-2014]